MWYKNGVPRIKNYHLAWYDMTRDGKCFDESFYEPNEIGEVIPFAETIEDEGKHDRSRVFVNFDDGDMYELKLVRVNKDKYSFFDNEDSFDEDEDEYISIYETKSMKFIWGVKSWDDITGADACLGTMNDIDVVYDKDRGLYMLGVETAYLFKTYGDECQYLKDCLKAFTKYMDDNGLNKNESYRLWMSNPCTNMEAETIEELYTNFKIFVDGFCNLDIDADEQRH